MRVGTRSVLFGVHQFLLHPLFVLVAWWRLYGRPSWAEVMAILVHDAGYWGAKDMEGPSGLLHPERGARLLKWLGFGSYAVSLVRRHSRSYAERIGLEPSRLCWADKFSFVLEPAWFYLLRARLSGELVEYRHKAAAAGLVPLDASDLTWFHAVREALYWEVAEATVDEGVQRLFHEYWVGFGLRYRQQVQQAFRASRDVRIIEVHTFPDTPGAAVARLVSPHTWGTLPLFVNHRASPLELLTPVSPHDGSVAYTVAGFARAYGWRPDGLTADEGEPGPAGSLAPAPEEADVRRFQRHLRNLLETPGAELVLAGEEGHRFLQFAQRQTRGRAALTARTDGERMIVQAAG